MITFGTLVHSIVDKGIFGLRVISGIVIGIEYTNKTPKYCIGFGDNSVWVNKVATNDKELLEMLKLSDLEKVKEVGANVNLPTDGEV